jgi:hypothetical protein
MQSLLEVTQIHLHVLQAELLLLITMRFPGLLLIQQ